MSDDIKNNYQYYFLFGAREAGFNGAPFIPAALRGPRLCHDSVSKVETRASLDS